MDLEELILYIQNQIKKIENEINESVATVEEFEAIKYILYSEEIKKNDAIKYITDSKKIINYSEPIINILNDINILEDLMDQIKTNLENLDIEKFKLNLSDSQELLNNLGNLKNLYRFAVNPAFKDEELKNHILLLKSKILDEISSDINVKKLDLKKIIESIEIRVSKKYKIKDNIELLENLKIYLDICKKRKIVRSEKELKEFFEFIKQSTLPKDVIYRIIIDFSKSNIVYYNNLIRKKLSRDKIIVNKNKEIVHNQLKQIAEQEILPTVDVVQETLEVLTKEEQKVYQEVENLLETYTYDDIFCQLFEDNYSLEDRIEYYGTEEEIDFETIKSDFVYILKPNLLGKNKEKIFNIFNYILKLNEKHLSYQEKVRTEKAQIDKKTQDIIEKVEPILRKYRHEIENLNINDKYKNLCKEIYRLSKEGNEDATLIAEGLQQPVSYFEHLYIINEINELYEYITCNELSMVELNSMYEELNKLILEYELTLEKLPKEKTEEQNYKYDGKNFVCFMNEDIDYSDEGKKNEILKSIKNLKNYEWADIVSCRSKNHLWSDLRYRVASGKETDYRDELFSAGRMWSTGTYRTGLVIIKNINPENKEKIKNRYNLEKVGIIAFIIGAIYVEADHSQYNEFVRFVNDTQNRATIDYYVALFMDPNTPEEKLFEILDKGIIDCEKINSSQPNIGGAVYE